MTGRPTLKTPELLIELCRRIAEGRSVASVAKDEDMPSHPTIWRWLFEDESFRDAYARAITARAMSHADRIDDLAEATVRGEIPPDVARVAIDAKKWTASRLLPKVYGDKQQVEATVTHTHTLHLEALKELSSRARGHDLGYNGAQVIDVAAVPAFQVERQGAGEGPIDVLPAPSAPPRPPRQAGGRGARARAPTSPPTDGKRTDPLPPTPSARKARPSKKLKNGDLA